MTVTARTSTKKTLEQMQIEHNKRMERKKFRKNRIGILIVVNPDTKKQRKLEKAADDFRNEGKADNWLKTWRKKNSKS